MQSSGFVYMSFTLPILNLEKWQCYSEVDLFSMGPERRTQEWQIRIQYIQGAIISIGVIQMLLGYSGKLIQMHSPDKRRVGNLEADQSIKVLYFTQLLL